MILKIVVIIIGLLILKSIFSKSDSSSRLPKIGINPTCTLCNKLGRLCTLCSKQVEQIEHQTTLKGYDPVRKVNWESRNKIEIDKKKGK